MEEAGELLAAVVVAQEIQNALVVVTGLIVRIAEVLDIWIAMNVAAVVKWIVRTVVERGKMIKLSIITQKRSGDYV